MVRSGFETVPDDIFLHDQTIASAISTLNTDFDLRQLLDMRRPFVSASGVPIEVALPVSDTRPLGEYDSMTIRAGGFANGSHDLSGYVSDLEIAELTQTPVVRLFSRSRSWRDAHPTEFMNGWRKASEGTKDDVSLAIFEDMALELRDGLRDIAGADDEFCLPDKVRLMAESGGSPVALGLFAHLEHDHEVLSFAGLATPNVMARTIWLELLGRDFLHSADLPGGMGAQVAEGKLTYEALVKVRNMDGEPHTRLRDVKGGLNYFYHDVFGGLRLATYDYNHTHAAALSRPTASRMVQPLLDAEVPVILGVLEHDPVAPVDITSTHFAQQANHPNVQTVVFGNRDHAGCVNPYILGTMAGLALKQEAG